MTGIRGHKWNYYRYHLCKASVLKRVDVTPRPSPIMHLSYPFSAFLLAGSLSFCSFWCSSYAVTSLRDRKGKLSDQISSMTKCFNAHFLNSLVSDGNGETYMLMSLPKSSRNSTLRWEKRRRDSRGIGLFRARSKQAKISASFCDTSPLYSSSSRFRYSFGLVCNVTKTSMWQIRAIQQQQQSGLWILFKKLHGFGAEFTEGKGLYQIYNKTQRQSETQKLNWCQNKDWWKLKCLFLNLQPNSLPVVYTSHPS